MCSIVLWIFAEALFSPGSKIQPECSNHKLTTGGNMRIIHIMDVMTHVTHIHRWSEQHVAPFFQQEKLQCLVGHFDVLHMQLVCKSVPPEKCRQNSLIMRRNMWVFYVFFFTVKLREFAKNA